MSIHCADMLIEANKDNMNTVNRFFIIFYLMVIDLYLIR